MESTLGAVDLERDLNGRGHDSLTKPGKNVERSQKAKGDDLEIAVERIEEALLASYPSLRGKPARIQRDARPVENGVTFQIDVLVTTDPDTLDETRHIFECKNWRAAVGIDEIQKLDSKQRALNARSATMVGRSFTAPAKRFAENLGIHILIAGEELVPISVVHAPHLSHEAVDGSITLQFCQHDSEIPANLDHQAQCELEGRWSTVHAVFDFVHRHLRKRIEADPRSRLLGCHTGAITFRINLHRGTLRVQGVEVAWIDARIDYLAVVTLPAIVTQLGVENRGGLIRVEYPPGTAGVKSLALEILTKPMPAK